MGAEESSQKETESWANNVSIIDKCIEQQAQYSDEQLQQIYETNEIPEEHQTLYTKFHKAWSHHLQNSKQYYDLASSKLKNGKCCRFTEKNMNANTIQTTTISMQEWTHIKACHGKLYEALQKSNRRQHRYNRMDVIERRRESLSRHSITQNIQQSTTKIEQKVSCNDVNRQKRSSSFLSQPNQPILIHKKSHQCTDAENCDDYREFCQTYLKINMETEPELKYEKYSHCILYHVEDFPEQCRCKQWDSASKTMQHIIHGHWYHRYALDQLQNDKQQSEERKKHTPNIRYKTTKHKPKLSTMASLKRVMAAPAVSDDFNKLQFGEPYTLKLDSAKFKNAKEEMLKNSFRKLNKPEWNSLLRKCVLFAKAYDARRSNLTIKEIVALKLYTDFDELQRQFRMCFRMEELQRQREFFWWNQLLGIACSKSQDKITKKIYHGVSSELILSTFSGTYYGPVSTTTIYDVARGFAGKSGKILELYPSFGKKGLKVNWLSNFPDEEEILYMNTSFQIHNIYSANDGQPRVSIIGGIKGANTNKAFEYAVMEAIQSINVDSKVISLNVNNKYSIEEKDEKHSITGDDTSGFVELSDRTQLAVLYLLYLQYRKEEWDNFVDKSNDFVRQAFERFRSEFVLLAENVKAVHMERLSKIMQQFFYTKQKQYKFPFAAYNTNHGKKRQRNITFEPNKPFQIETIIRLFPNAEQISINGNNWDFSLNHFIGFLKKFDMDYANVKLQDIYIKFANKKTVSGSKNIRFEIVTDDEKAQELMNKSVNAREQITTLRKLGWRFVTPSHLHRVGFEPAPELPFVMAFVKARKNTKFFYQSYSMRFTTQQIQAIDTFKDDECEPGTECFTADELEPGQAPVSPSYHEWDSDGEHKSLEQVNDEMCDGDKYVVVHHNPANCILNSKMFSTLEYKDELIELLRFRKERKKYRKQDYKKVKFTELCKRVETLVLDPMPKALLDIFMEYPNNNKFRGMISFETIYKMFPNVKELFLRHTVLNLRICYSLVKFEKEYGEEAVLERVFFQRLKGSDEVKDRHVMRYRLVLEPHSWQMTKSECMIQKYNDIIT